MRVESSQKAGGMERGETVILCRMPLACVLIQGGGVLGEEMGFVWGVAAAIPPFGIVTPLLIVFHQLLDGQP